MKKTKLTRSLLAACSIVALTAVMYGCVHNGSSDPEPMVEPMPEPEPEPDPGPPADLTDTQAAAAEAAMDAMESATSADTAATSAEGATATLATLQTGDDASALALGGNEDATASRSYATVAMTASNTAAAASTTAAAATTGPEAEAAWRRAENAKDDAEAAAAKASEHSEAAIKDAMTELHIAKDANEKYNLYSAGMRQADDTIVVSSLDATADKTTSPAGDRVTGFIVNVSRDSDAVGGQAYVEATNTPYRQAVAARSLAIGKTVDTSNDKARLTVIHSRATSEMMRVYVVNDSGTPAANVMDSGAGILIADADSDPTTLADNTYAPLKSLGMYIEAADVAAGTDGTYADPLVDETGTTEFTDAVGNDDYANNLDHGDLVEADTKPKELFSFVDNDGNTQTVVESQRTIMADGSTTVTYLYVDTLAPAAADAHGLTDDGPATPSATETDENPESIVVRASIPTLEAYSYINFGVWAGLGAAAATDGSQDLAGLGIGFVQNIKGDVTERQGIGTVEYNGQWVAHVQRQNATAGTGAIKFEAGDAMMTANFDTEEFTANLMELATLTGTLSGNGFYGVTAAVDSDHTELDASGTFTGEFSGNIYGPKGTEAAGVFDFNGDEAGAFVGAFGGTNQD